MFLSSRSFRINRYHVNRLFKPEKVEMSEEKWGSPKKFLVEDIIVYSAVVVFNLLFDVGFNLALNLKLLHTPSMDHPYEFGYIQALIIFICIIQLVRKWEQWRYLTRFGVCP